MRRYETTYIVRPNVGEEQLNEIIGRTNAIITDDGGAIINLERWGLRKLAFDIKKENQGHYVHVDYAAQGAVVDEMERIFRIDDRIVRYLTIKTGDSIDQEMVEQEKERIAQQAAAPKVSKSDDDDEDADDLDIEE